MTEKRSKRKQRFILLLFLCVLVGVFPVWYYSLTPEGVYYDKNIACEYAYWIFKDGRIYLKTPETYKFISTYSKSEGRWVVSASPRTELTILKPSLLGIKTEYPAKPQYDRFWPRRGFSWLFTAMDTVRKHGRP
jgi:hypothetical protein